MTAFGNDGCGTFGNDEQGVCKRFFKVLNQKRSSYLSAPICGKKAYVSLDVSGALPARLKLFSAFLTTPKDSIKNMKPIILLLYIYVLALLHVMPLGGGDLSRITFCWFRADYLLHTLVFLPWLPLCALLIPGWRSWSLRLLVGVALALGLEALQSPLSYRSFNPMDALFNVSGVLLGGLVVRLLVDRFRSIA